MTAPARLICDYASLVNEIGLFLFGLRPTTTDVVTEAKGTADQRSDILRCMDKGLQFVYAAHRWSFMRSPVNIVTHPAYSTGTITVDALGNVTGIGTTFPAYSASAGGGPPIPSVGSYAIATYSSGDALTLSGYNGGAVAVATIYSIGFNTYPVPTGVDSLEGQLTHIQGASAPAEPLSKIAEVEIRKMLARYNSPSRPKFYALVMKTFDPTVGSSRCITLYPVPDAQYTLTAIGTLCPTVVDATNKYPLGAELLSACLTESCLAAAEREVLGQDAGHPDAVHNRSLAPMLTAAIQRDKEASTPDTLGVNRNGESSGYHHFGDVRPGGIYWDGGGGVTGWI